VNRSSADDGWGGSGVSMISSKQSEVQLSLVLCFKIIYVSIENLKWYAFGCGINSSTIANALNQSPFSFPKFFVCKSFPTPFS